MFSIASGRISAIRLEGLSWVDVGAPPASASVTAFNPAEVDVLSTNTPSTTYKGWVLPYTEVTPRSLTEMPPPGEPEFALIYAPGIFPSRAASNVCAGAPSFNSFEEMVATALARFRLFTVVARPVTTTSSRWATSSSSRILTYWPSSPDRTILGANPAEVIINVALGVTANLKLPSASLVVPRDVPLIRMLAPGTALP